MRKTVNLDAAEFNLGINFLKVPSGDEDQSSIRLLFQARGCSPHSVDISFQEFEAIRQMLNESQSDMFRRSPKQKTYSK